jgi:hypothetical protein
LAKPLNQKAKDGILRERKTSAVRLNHSCMLKDQVVCSEMGDRQPLFFSPVIKELPPFLSIQTLKIIFLVCDRQNFFHHLPSSPRVE